MLRTIRPSRPAFLYADILKQFQISFPLEKNMSSNADHHDQC